MTDKLQLKYGTSEQVDQAQYAAGTMYLSKKTTDAADLFFDLENTRLKITPDALEEEAIEDFIDNIMFQYDKNEGLNNSQVNDMIDDIWAGV